MAVVAWTSILGLKSCFLGDCGFGFSSSELDSSSSNPPGGLGVSSWLVSLTSCGGGVVCLVKSR